MDVFSAVLCVIFTTIAASYAWGMRGAVIGGEKGAMLPGVFIGTVLAWFSGGAIRENFWIIAAAGLMGMTFGGTETYGETIGMVLHRGRADYRPVKGYAGLAVKGALWFSVCGGFIAFAFSAMSGSVYSTADIVIFCVLIPVIQQVGYRVFNKPYDKARGIHPQIYYSVTRREEWGSNLALVFAMLTLAVIKNDGLMLTMLSCGLIAGSAGWVAAMKAYEYSVFPMSNGRYLFDKIYRKGIFDGWKLMEFILGAAGGLGLSIGFCTQYDVIEKYNRIIEEKGRFSPLAHFEEFMPYAAALFVFAILIINIYQFVCGKRGKKVNSFICDQIERPFYNVAPMLLVLLGSLSVARIMTAFMLIFVCTVKCAFDRFEKAKFVYLLQAVMLAVCAAVFAGDIILGGYSPFMIMVAGTVPYLLMEFVWVVSDSRRNKMPLKSAITKTAFATVFPCFCVMSAVILLISYKIFEF